MNTQRQTETALESEQSWFYTNFESALKSDVENMGGQLDIFYSKHNPGIVQAYSVKFSDSPVAITIYPEPLFKHWKNGLEMPQLIQTVMRSVKHEKPLNFSDFVIKKENAATHLKAGLIKIEGAEKWLKSVPHERYGDSVIVADWYFSDDEKITLHDCMLSVLQMTREELLAQAKLNSSLEFPTLKTTNTQTEKNISIGDIHRHRR
ncbi:DUF5688 family protein [Enterocloster clostridioformis]|uniref:DUF5688 family protein n=1 Tax=Enterocloster clostridioformis TaxID=1531 RepID=UPI0022E659D5|nr:DUF5688 family protein [Enterocloster clostridioformis]